MPHSRPKTITNRGDAWRLTTAAGHFIRELTTDERVQAFYACWRQAREDAYDVLVIAQERLEASQLHAARRAYVDRNLATTERFLRDVNLKADWVPWVALSLLNVFPLWMAWTPESPEPQFSIPVKWLPPGMPKGRVPPRGGQAIAQNVRWVYLVDVKHPDEDIIHALAREYEAAVGRVTDARSVVQLGLKQGRALLDLVAKTTVRVIE